MVLQKLYSLSSIQTPIATNTVMKSQNCVNVVEHSPQLIPNGQICLLSGKIYKVTSFSVVYAFEFLVMGKYVPICMQVSAEAKRHKVPWSQS